MLRRSLVALELWGLTCQATQAWDLGKRGEFTVKQLTVSLLQEVSSLQGWYVCFRLFLSLSSWFLVSVLYLPKQGCISFSVAIFNLE